MLVVAAGGQLVQVAFKVRHIANLLDAGEVCGFVGLDAGAGPASTVARVSCSRMRIESGDKISMSSVSCLMPKPGVTCNTTDMSYNDTVSEFS